MICSIHGRHININAIKKIALVEELLKWQYIKVNERKSVFGEVIPEHYISAWNHERVAKATAVIPYAIKIWFSEESIPEIFAFYNAHEAESHFSRLLKEVINHE